MEIDLINDIRDIHKVKVDISDTKRYILIDTRLFETETCSIDLQFFFGEW